MHSGRDGRRSRDVLRGRYRRWRAGVRHRGCTRRVAAPIPPLTSARCWRCSRSAARATRWSTSACARPGTRCRRGSLGRQLPSPLRSRRPQRRVPGRRRSMCGPANWTWAERASTKPSGVLPGDLAELVVEPWDYDDDVRLAAGRDDDLDARAHARPPGNAGLVHDGRSFVCAGDAAYTLQAVVEHRPTGRPTDVDQAKASLRYADLAGRRDPDRPRHRPMARRERSDR